MQGRAQSHADLKKAQEKCQQTLRIYERVGYKEGIGLVANNLGLIYADWGQYDKAMKFYEKSLAIYRGCNDRKREAQALNGLGIVLITFDFFSRREDLRIHGV